MSLSSSPPLRLHNPADSDSAAPASPQNPSPSVLTDRWPTLSKALSRYQQSTAEFFSQAAYDAVSQGLIRLDDRRRLANLASAQGIRPFDAQLLIACAIRQWALDHRYDPTPSNKAPALSFEYKSWSKACLRVALLLTTAAILDGIIIYKWLS